VGAVAGVVGGESASGILGDCGVLEVNGVAAWLGDDGVEGEGGKKQPSSCGICLFFTMTTVQLLARVASLLVFVCFQCGWASCSNTAGINRVGHGGEAGWSGGDGGVASEGVAGPAVAGVVVAVSSSSGG
jgi:hypothetical protein